MAVYRLCVAVCFLFMTQGKKIEDVEDLSFEPKIAVRCDKVAKYIDVDTGKWTDSGEKFCSSDSTQLLKFCQKTYPNIDVTNIVEANENVTVCDAQACETTYSIVPYRCLVGKFEADALSYPPTSDCDFGYVHEGKTCKNHAYWKARASHICNSKGKHMDNYGILVPCGTDLFNGVEYVCCKKRIAVEVSKPTEKIAIEGVETDVVPTTEAKTDAEILEGLLDKFAAHIPADSKGCDRSIYNTKIELLHAEKDSKVKKLAKDLNEAKAQMEELKKDDPEQAKSLFKKTLHIFQRTLKNIESQAKLDQSQISQQKKACAQVALNHKKHLAMRAFVHAVRQNGDKPAKIIKTFQRFLTVLENDQQQNMHTLSKKLLTEGPSVLMSARDTFLAHLKVVKTALKESVDILRKVESVQGEMDFNLPPFATDIDFEFAHKPKTTAPPPTTEAPAPENADGTLGLDEDESSPENEHDRTRPVYERPNYSEPRMSPGLKKHHREQSRTVFAAIIGLAIGTLVIAIIIILAVIAKRRSPKRSTKTVIADDDNVEKRHLLKMQEAGFENPTYKFFAN